MLDQVALRAILAHRHPMLLVDRVELSADQRSLVGYKCVTSAEPCYAELDHGQREHFAYPYSLIIESFAQSLGVLLSRHWVHALGSREHVAMFGGMRGLRFYGDVLPGDTMVHRASIDKATDDTALLSGTVSVEARTVAAFEQIIGVIRPVSELRSVAR